MRPRAVPAELGGGTPTTSAGGTGERKAMKVLHSLHWGDSPSQSWPGGKPGWGGESQPWGKPPPQSFPKASS